MKKIISSILLVFLFLLSSCGPNVKEKSFINEVSKEEFQIEFTKILNDMKASVENGKDSVLSFKDIEKSKCIIKDDLSYKSNRGNKKYKTITKFKFDGDKNSYLVEYDKREKKNNYDVDILGDKNYHFKEKYFSGTYNGKDYYVDLYTKETTKASSTIIDTYKHYIDTYFSVPQIFSFNFQFDLKYYVNDNVYTILLDKTETINNEVKTYKTIIQYMASDDKVSMREEWNIEYTKEEDNKKTTIKSKDIQTIIFEYKKVNNSKYAISDYI